MPDQPRVTVHAMLRYLERVNGLRVEDWRRDLAELAQRPAEKITPGELLDFILDAHGKTQAAMAAQICPPGAVKAWRAGARTWRRDGVRLVFGDDHVATVLTGARGMGAAGSRHDINKRRRVRRRASA